MQRRRLGTGGAIDRSQPLSFRFDGRRYEAYAGDTLASALLANGVDIVGRSFKLHRPRGIVAMDAAEPNAIVQVGSGAHTEPNLRATQVELYDGLEARSTRGWPGLRFDIGALNDRLSALFAAGFYYKTFMRPRRAWQLYEKLIRRSAGFGTAPEQPDPDDYAHRNAHCDVLVVGAGPAGLTAARVAAEAGARVLLVDERAAPGGSLAGSGEAVDGNSADRWIAAMRERLEAMDNVRVLSRATAFGYYDHNFVAIAERCTDHQPPAARRGVRQRLWRVRARYVVLAQGAIERPLVFCNNDRPGVMLASAVTTLIRRYAVLPGRRAVVFTNNDSAYAAAADLLAAGAAVTVVDSRAAGGGSVAEAAESAGATVLRGHVVCDVRGRGRVRAVRVAKWDGDEAATVAADMTIDCDLVAMSGGWSPAVHLHSQAGGINRWDDGSACFLPFESRQANCSAGAGNGKFSLADCLADGHAAGRTALRHLGIDTPEWAVPRAAETVAAALQPLWRVPADRDPDRCAKQFVDFQNDTSAADIRLAAREGYRSVEHVKRYTALGFGTDQGKLGNINGMAILAATLGKPIADVGTTTFRPAYTPVTFGTGAGESVGALYDPVRKSAIHDWHVAAGAPMECVGQWHRPWYFPQPGEDLHAAVARECLAARNSLGVMDASTLGKIDARGPDVVEFLERIYTHDVGRMKVGRCAYGIMLGEDGMLMDDGVMARLGEQRFYLTTTTGGAANVLAWLEKWLQTEWPELDVWLTSLTDPFSTIAVVGPNSRRLLEKIGCDTALDRESFPFMSVHDALLGGIDVQLFRVSFSGELAFEINVDSRYALAMWERLMDAGREFDITPYGTETMHVLRAEKGFVIVGQDTDGSVSPLDLGMKWLLAGDKDYLGKRSLERSDLKRRNRKHLVGLRSVDGRTVLPEGTQLVDDPAVPPPVPMCGHVTSSYYSACLDRPIALALVAGGRGRRGETIHAALPGRDALPVEIVAPVFYDPKGERQHV